MPFGVGYGAKIMGGMRRAGVGMSSGAMGPAMAGLRKGAMYAGTHGGKKALADRMMLKAAGKGYLSGDIGTGLANNARSRAMRRGRNRMIGGGIGLGGIGLAGHSAATRGLRGRSSGGTTLSQQAAMQGMY